MSIMDSTIAMMYRIYGANSKFDKVSIGYGLTVYVVDTQSKILNKYCVDGSNYKRFLNTGAVMKTFDIIKEYAVL